MNLAELKSEADRLRSEHTHAHELARLAQEMERGR